MLGRKVIVVFVLLFIVCVLRDIADGNENVRSRKKKELTAEQKLKRAGRRAARRRSAEEKEIHDQTSPTQSYQNFDFVSSSKKIFKQGALNPYLSQILGSGDDPLPTSHGADMEEIMGLLFDLNEVNDTTSGMVEEGEVKWPGGSNPWDILELYRKSVLPDGKGNSLTRESSIHERSYSDNVLRQVSEILQEKGNASLRIVNGKVTVDLEDTKESTEKDDSPIEALKNITSPENFDRVCKLLMGNNVTASTKNTLTLIGKKEEFAQILSERSEGNISMEEYKKKLREELDGMGISLQCLNATTESTTPFTMRETTVPLYDRKMAKIREIIDEGYLDPSVIDQLERGEITMKEIEYDLMRNEAFVLSQLNPNITSMYEAGRVPEDLAHDMFSGNYSMSEIRYMVYQDNTVSKELLPEQIRDILEARDPPQELKDMLYDGDNDTEIAMQVMSNDTLLEEMMSPSMFYFYNLFKIPRNVAINMALSGTTILALCSVMTSLGCTMTVDQIMDHVRKPKGVIIALTSQYGIMPAAAFGLTQLFKLDVYPAISVLICGCCPGGNLSNMLAYAINGDMNLSILMTTCSSVIGLGMMPLLLFLYSRFIIPVNSSEIVPFDKIILNVALTIIPVGIGIAIKRYRPGWTTNVMRFGAIMLVLCSIVFATLAGFLLGDKFFVFFPSEVVACAAILPLTGYIFGFCFARLFKENQKCCRTICVETGCQNVQLCGTVLKLAFDPILVGVMILLPIIYMAFQATEALLLVMLYRLYERCTGKKSEEKKEMDFDSDDDEKKADDDSDIKACKKEKEHLNKNNESKLVQEDSVTNGDAVKNHATDPKDEEAVETWPLVGDNSPDYLDSFKNADKENTV